ncbi:MAG: F0F1 ATP synthase subunit B [Anaerolineales bacterium]|nr:F0F1 ATP synthase subunit B [Anaerolineales bacterium]
MEGLGINIGLLIAQTLNIAIVFIVLTAWIYRPVKGLLKNRRETIAQGLEDARVAAEARQNAESEAEKITADAQARAAEIVRDATERAEKTALDTQTSAEAEAAGARAEALAEVHLERDRMLSELRGQVAARSMAAAQKLVGDALDENRQRALIQAFFSGVESGKVVVLEDASVSGASAVVTSALPLSESEQQTVKDSVLSKTGAGTDVVFRVDPSILGGLVIRVGDKVLDGSVSGQLEDMRQRMR